MIYSKLIFIVLFINTYILCFTQPGLREPSRNSISIMDTNYTLYTSNSVEPITKYISKFSYFKINDTLILNAFDRETKKLVYQISFIDTFQKIRSNSEYCLYHFWGGYKSIFGRYIYYLPLDNCTDVDFSQAKAHTIKVEELCFVGLLTKKTSKSKKSSLLKYSKNDE